MMSNSTGRAKVVLVICLAKQLHQLGKRNKMWERSTCVSSWSGCNTTSWFL